MEYALDRFERELRDVLRDQARIPDELLEVGPPKANVAADRSFPTFAVARVRGVLPTDLARELATTLRFGLESLVGNVEAVGPYLNIRAETNKFAAAVLGEVARLGDRYGHDDLGGGKTVLVEYSSPNMARRMHVGHIRSTIIGQAIANIVAGLGYHIVRDSHIGDWGKNFGILLTAIQHEGRPEGEGEEALALLEQLYARYSRLTGEDPAIDAEARSWSLRLERGDPVARDLWRWIVDLTLNANQGLYDRLGVHFDTIHGESFFNDRMDPIVCRALDGGVARRNADQAVAVELADLPTFLLQRSDGGTLYHTRDVATLVFREESYHPNVIVYVVDARQELHFRQLFALARALGYVLETDLVHVSFGVITGPDGQPLAARRGNMVFLQALLDEAHRRARMIVEGTSSALTDAEKDQIAEEVGIGAVIYNDLYQDPRRNISLDWDRILALQGNSAPYIQYMYARCRSILRRAADEGHLPSKASLTKGNNLAVNPSLLNHPAEAALIKQLARLPHAVREAGARYAPFVLAEWCYDTARSVSTFYRDWGACRNPRKTSAG